ncbi:MAG: metal ABC transporter permease [Planctomycetes bacterium]|nr:metal ABC transporter permease [Planctomycetota bacterium]
MPLARRASEVRCVAVLRRRALTGDAVSHAALPGVCVAFLVAGERRLPILLFGAFLSGLLGAMTISALRRWTRIKEDAAVGIVLSVFVGAGFALSRIIQGSVTGGSKAGLNSYILGKTAGMIAQDVYLISATALLCLVLVVLLYKEFKLISFDAGFARVQGWPAQPLDLLLMALLAATVVIGLPAVGAVLMAALLILPAATARLWTDRLGTMLLLAAGFGAATGAAGTLLSASHEKLPAGPVIVLAGASFFLASLFLAPRRGLVAGLLARLRFERELQERYLLRVLFDLVEPQGSDHGSQNGPTTVSFDDLLGRRSWGRSRLARLLARAVRQGHLEWCGADRYALTEAGLRRAAAVARGHRLWALFLTEYADLAAGTANLAEESVESLLPPDVVADLYRKLDQPEAQARGALSPRAQ